MKTLYFFLTALTLMSWTAVAKDHRILHIDYQSLIDKSDLIAVGTLRSAPNLGSRDYDCFSVDDREDLWAVPGIKNPVILLPIAILSTEGSIPKFKEGTRYLLFLKKSDQKVADEHTPFEVVGFWRGAVPLEATMDPRVAVGTLDQAKIDVVAEKEPFVAAFRYVLQKKEPEASIEKRTKEIVQKLGIGSRAGTIEVQLPGS